MSVALRKLWTDQNPIPELSDVADWYVNAATGSAANDGQDPATPFASIGTASALLCPNGARFRLRQNVTVHVIDVVAQTYGPSAWNVDLNGFTFRILCSVSSSAPIVLATVTNTNAATATRGRITTATVGAFATALQQRLRVVVGVNAGAISYCNGVTSGTDIFVQEWTSAAGTVTTVSAGNSVVIDTLLTSLGTLGVQTVGAGSFIVQDAITVGSCSSYGSEYQTATVGAPILYGCEIGPSTGGPGTARFFGSWAWLSPRLTNENAAGFQGSIVATGLSLQAFLALTQGSQFIARAGCAVDNSRGWVLTQGATLTFAANCEFENGVGGPALAINEGCAVECASGSPLRLWGVAGGYAIPITIANGRCDQNNFLISIPGSTALPNRAAIPAPTVGVRVNGIDLAYNELPFRSGAASYGNNFQNFTKARFVFEAQAVALAVQAFFPGTVSIPPKGLYSVSVHMVNNAGTSGNLVLSVAGADRVGVYTQTKTLAIGGTSRLDEVMEVKTDGVNPFTWGVALDTVVGTPSLDIELVAERIG